ncbi:hypothetical protein PILCRDRAFT_826179 [Piloderma croceum F 1598]|uniref:Uncharacterized protein n=1 Tax=Piloderma croceum (strain F 1598) TaxID=765440 RepID=A0A0C3FA88_PILCF|nr:hypothetical protein PILCRDRAFT_826179 [Piloderma croceum F 1598]
MRMHQLLDGIATQVLRQYRRLPCLNVKGNPKLTDDFNSRDGLPCLVTLVGDSLYSLRLSMLDVKTKHASESLT